MPDEPPISRDEFLAWRAPRRGEANPQDQTNPVWTWLARNPDMSAYQANKLFDGPHSMSVGEGWCANRFGQSTTPLPDGRVIAIAGEHEDYYDPDFYIYNDVFVTAPSGELTIYGYPEDVFPPTDFHTATLVDDRIVIVGNLGYAQQRRVGSTQVRVLDTRTFQISTPATSGDAPGWIHKHDATLAEDRRSLTVTGGLVEDDSPGSVHTENIDDWQLDLVTWTWTRLTDRRWQQWEIERTDGHTNRLFWIEQMQWHGARSDPYDRERLAELVAKHGAADLELYAARYAPPFAHQPLPGSNEYPRVIRVRVGEVTIRYVEGSRGVRIVVEGRLEDDQIAALVEDARSKLERLEGAPVLKRRIG